MVELNKIYDEITHEQSLYINANNLEIVRLEERIVLSERDGEPCEPYEETIYKYKIIPYAPPIGQHISELKARLATLSEDIIQDQVGEIVPDIMARKAEFVTLHNELRGLLDLELRGVK